MIFSSRCFDSTRKIVHTGQGPSMCTCLSPSLSLLTVLCSYQLAFEGRPCTRRAAGLGDREWPVGRRWLVAGGEGVGRASTCEWSARTSRRRVHLPDQCSPQICRRPHHTRTVAGKEGRLTCKSHQTTFGSWNRYLLLRSSYTGHQGHTVLDTEL